MYASPASLFVALLLGGGWPGEKCAGVDAGPFVSSGSDQLHLQQYISSKARDSLWALVKIKTASLYSLKWKQVHLSVVREQEKAFCERSFSPEDGVIKHPFPPPTHPICMRWVCTLCAGHPAHFFGHCYARKYFASARFVWDHWRPTHYQLYTGDKYRVLAFRCLELNV
jgi:hypothetical protein